MPLASWNHISLYGTIDQKQSWSVGLNFALGTGEAGPDSVSDLTAWAQAIRALNGQNIVTGTMRAFMGAGVLITGIRAAAVNGATGRESAMAKIDLASAIPGLNGPAQAPEIAVCVSLLTGGAGRQNRGRVYWPGCGRTVGADHRYGTSDTDALASDFAGFLQDVANASGDSAGGDGGTGTGPVDLQPVVVSRKGSHASAVLSVAVGNVPDVQRRRRDKEQESYSVHAVTS